MSRRRYVLRTFHFQLGGDSLTCSSLLVEATTTTGVRIRLPLSAENGSSLHVVRPDLVTLFLLARRYVEDLERRYSKAQRLLSRVRMLLPKAAFLFLCTRACANMYSPPADDQHRTQE